MREAILEEGRAIYRPFTLSEMQALSQAFPNLTEPVDPSNPHKIVPNPP